MHFDHLELGRCHEAALAHIAAVTVTATATATARTTAPVGATGTGVATGFDFLLLGRVVLPGGRQVLGLDFLLPGRARHSRRTGRRGSGFAGRASGFVQGAFDAGLVGRGLGLLGHQGLGRGGHHGADVGGFGLGLAAALHQILGAQILGLFGLCVLVGQHTGRRFTL